jgi:hypothetical protein
MGPVSNRAGHFANLSASLRSNRQSTAKRNQSRPEAAVRACDAPTRAAVVPSELVNNLYPTGAVDRVTERSLNAASHNDPLCFGFVTRQSSLGMRLDADFEAQTVAQAVRD